MRKTIQANQTLVNNVEDYAVVLLDEKGNIRYWNKGAEKITGYSSEDILDANFRILFDEEGRKNLAPERLLSESEKNGKAIYEGWKLKKDGTAFWAYVVCTNIYNDENELVGFTKIITDLTEGKRKAELEHNTLNALINNLSGILWSVDRGYNLLTTNQAFDAIAKHHLGENVEKGRYLPDLQLSPEQIIRFKDYYDRAFAGEAFAETEYLPEPTNRWFEMSFNPIRNGNEIIGTACYARDVTELKAAQLQVINSERRFRTLIENSTDGFIIYSADMSIQYVSPSIEGIVGYTDEEIMQKGVGPLIHPDDLEKRRLALQQALDNPGVPINAPNGRRKHKDGSWRWVEATNTNMLNDPAIQGIVVNFRDITERVISQEEHLHNEQQLKETQTLAQFGSWKLEFQKGDAVWSEECCKIYGLPITDNKHSFESWLSFVHPDDLEEVEKRSSEAQGSLKNWSLEYRIKRRDGSVRYMESISHYEFDSENKPIGIFGAIHDITDRKLAEEKGRASEHKFQTLIENSADGLIIISAEGKIAYVSPSAENILGYSAEEAFQIDLASIVRPEDLAQRDAVMAKVIANPGKPISGYTKQMRHKNGNWRWIEYTMTNMLHDPTINGIVDNFRDVTNRILAEEKQKRSDLRLKQAQELAHFGTWELDLSTGITYWSEERCRIFGVDITDNIQSYDSWLSFVHPEDRESVENISKKSEAELSSWQIPYRIIRKDGTIRHIESTAHYDYDDENKPIAIYGTVHDVTEGVLANEKEKASEHKFRSLIENSTDGIVIFSPQLTLQYISPSVQTILGYSEEELRAINIFDLFHPDDVPASQKIIENCLANPGKAILGHTGRLKHKNGCWRWIESVVTNLLDDPAVNGIVDNFRDITESKLGQETLVRSDLRMKQAQAIAHFGSWEMDLSSRIISWSEETYRILGLPEDTGTMHFDSWLALIHPDDVDNVLNAISEARKNYSGFNIYHRVVHQDGTIKHIHLQANYELDSAGQAQHVFGAVHDITERIVAEEKENASERKIQVPD